MPIEIRAALEDWGLLPRRRSVTNPPDIAAPVAAIPTQEPSAAIGQTAAAAVDPTLAEWLPDFSRGRDFAELIRRFAGVDGSITSVRESAMLYALIQRLRPKWTLEIGTFFAHTTRIMAEAIVDAGYAGHLITLDPFGADRVPGILRTWPEPLRAVTEFRPHSSMQYFLDLETLGTPKGAESPLGFVFVDGHHNFEYALFDIIRSADHLTPGGAIAVDNLEQEGPKLAVIQFLRWNPAWRFFFGRDVWAPGDVAPDMFRDTYNDEAKETYKTLWGVLLAPIGIQVARHSVKFMKRGIIYLDVNALCLNVRSTCGAGIVHANLSYYAIPFDYHITGKGLSLIGTQATALTTSEGSAQIRMQFDAPLVLNIENPDATNVCYELELSYQGNTADDFYLLLDALQPISLE